MSVTSVPSSGGGLSFLLSATAHDTSDTTLVSTVAMADVDARLALTITVPPPGLVYVTIEGWMAIVSGFTPFHYIREGSNVVPMIGVQNGGEVGYVPFFGGGNQSGRKSTGFICVLTPGSHTIKWSLRTDGGGSAQVKTGPSFGDAIIAAYAFTLG